MSSPGRIRKTIARTSTREIRRAIDPGESLRKGLRSVLRARLNRLFRSMDGPLENDDPETLHRMRVSLRRVQALLRLFSDCFPRKDLRIFAKELRSLIRKSGRVREIDLFVATADSYRSTVAPRERIALDLLIARRIRERRVARDALRDRLRELRKKRFKGNLSRFVTDSLG
jgi:CHAD domain-containing protein